MSDYIVSARKYRPMTFNSVVGQRALTTTSKMQLRRESWPMPIFSADQGGEWGGRLLARVFSAKL